MRMLSLNAVCIISIGIALTLILKDSPHWGWFIFIAIISLHTVSGGSDKDKKP